MTQSSDFWNEKFADDQYLFGVQPNAFVKSAAERWMPPGCDVLELGAGEGRNAVYLAQQDHSVTAADYSEKGLRKARALAAEAGVEIETIQIDIREWTPDRQWDAMVITFLHLLPAERTRLYERIQRLLRPGGLLLAEWFRPEQITEEYTSGGPPSEDFMITPQELRSQFPSEGIKFMKSVEPTLDEGSLHGPAATVRFVWRQTNGGDS